MSRWRRPSLGESFGYIPGEQPAAGEWLKLNTNESPLPPSPRVAPAVAKAAASLHLYPDPRGEPLRSALAHHHGVAPEQVHLGNGADEVLDTALRAFVEPGQVVVHTSPTYSLLPVLVRLLGARSEVVAGADDLAALRAEAPLRFVVNPLAPTGAWVEPEALLGALDGAPGVTVVDEAYADFAPASCLPLAAGREGWLVVRTFSKSYALAGLRVGYAVGSPHLVADLAAVAPSYPVDRCALAGALAALEDEEHHRRIVDTVLTERARLDAALRAAGWEVVPSQANFIFARPPGGGARVAAALREQGILVRRFEVENLQDYLRITVGTAGATDRLLDALRQLGEGVLAGHR